MNKENEVLTTFYIGESLKKELLIYSATTGQSIKEILNNLIQEKLLKEKMEGKC